MNFCGKPLPSRSKLDPKDLHRCYRAYGHTGRCEEFPFLTDLQQHHPRVRNKIIRDATKTTGAAWKSDDAGPNRISRWLMLLSDEQLRIIGVDMKSLRPGIVDKLRQKAAEYDACVKVSQKLTYFAYGMISAPVPATDTRKYLETLFGPISRGQTKCMVCAGLLDFRDFEQARRGRAEIETAHADPRIHSPENVGFAHRECNIAQGDKTLAEFDTWLVEILKRKGYGVTR